MRFLMTNQESQDHQSVGIISDKTILAESSLGGGRGSGNEADGKGAGGEEEPITAKQ